MGSEMCIRDRPQHLAVGRALRGHSHRRERSDRRNGGDAVRSPAQNVEPRALETPPATGGGSAGATPGANGGNTGGPTGTSIDESLPDVPKTPALPQLPEAPDVRTLLDPVTDIVPLPDVQLPAPLPQVQLP